MTDWNTVKYTGASEEFGSICINTTDKLFYTTFGSAVIQWDPVAGTRTSLGSPVSGSPSSLGINFFKGFLYAAWFKSSDFTAGIARYSGGSWSNVYTNAGTIINDFGNVSLTNVSDNQLVALFPMDCGTPDPPNCGEDVQRCVYSNDGSSWTRGKINGSYTGYFDPGVSISQLGTLRFGFLAQQLSPAHILGSDNPTLGSSSCHIYEWTGTDWAIHVSNFCTTSQAAAGTLRLQSVGLDKNWKLDGGTHYHSNVLTGGWVSIPAVNMAAGQFNFSITPGVRQDNTNGLVWWDDAALTWVGPLEDWLAGYGGGRFVLRFNDGDAYLIARNTGTGNDRILARSEPLSGPTWPPSNRALYIYRTENNGVDWATKKVET